MQSNTNDYVDIGPECFAKSDLSVISYKGTNYYRACDVLVMEYPDGGASHCVKRVNHPGTTHEDYDGRLRDDTAEEQLANYIRYNPHTTLTKETAEKIAKMLVNEGWRKS